MPYIPGMQAVIETATFLHDCRRLSEEERLSIVAAIAADPQLGDLIPGAGGHVSVDSPGAAKARAEVTAP
jgi:hypothetical protein